MLMPSIFGENLFDDFFGDFVRPVRNTVRYSTPAATAMKTDVKENKTSYELDIDLPGYKKEDIQAELKDGYLTISAATKNEKDEKDDSGRYIRRERFYGSCSRSFYVGDAVSQEEIKAKFEDGILKVSVPKKDALPEAEEKKYIAIEG